MEPPRVHDQRVTVPMRDRFTRVRSVQLLQWRVVPPIRWNHAVHGLRGDQSALAGVDENEIVRRLLNELRNAGARNSGRQAAIGGVFLIGVIVESPDLVPVFGLIDWSVRSYPPQQGGGALALVTRCCDGAEGAAGRAWERRDLGSGRDVVRRVFVVDENPAVLQLVWHAGQAVSLPVPHTGQVGMAVRCPRRGPSWFGCSIRRLAPRRRPRV